MTALGDWCPASGTKGDWTTCPGCGRRVRPSISSYYTVPRHRMPAGMLASVAQRAADETWARIGGRLRPTGGGTQTIAPEEHAAMPAENVGAYVAAMARAFAHLLAEGDEVLAEYVNERDIGVLREAARRLREVA